MKVFYNEANDSTAQSYQLSQRVCNNLTESGGSQKSPDSPPLLVTDCLEYTNTDKQSDTNSEKSEILECGQSISRTGTNFFIIYVIKPNRLFVLVLFAFSVKKH